MKEYKYGETVQKVTHELELDCVLYDLDKMTGEKVTEINGVDVEHKDLHRRIVKELLGGRFLDWLLDREFYVDTFNYKGEVIMILEDVYNVEKYICGNIIELCDLMLTKCVVQLDKDEVWIVVQVKSYLEDVERQEKYEKGV